MSRNKEMQDLIREATKQGWTIVQSKSLHTMIRCPCGCTQTVVSASPSDYRSIANTRMYLRRCKNWSAS